MFNCYLICLTNFNEVFDYKYDIYAQWQLTDKVEYDAAKEAVLNDITTVYEEKKGDWYCVYSEKDEKYNFEEEVLSKWKDQIIKIALK
mgnify:CR=1 FL=1